MLETFLYKHSSSEQSNSYTNTMSSRDSLLVIIPRLESPSRPTPNVRRRLSLATDRNEQTLRRTHGTLFTTSSLKATTPIRMSNWAFGKQSAANFADRFYPQHNMNRATARESAVPSRSLTCRTCSNTKISDCITARASSSFRTRINVKIIGGVHGGPKKAWSWMGGPAIKMP